VDYVSSSLDVEVLEKGKFKKLLFGEQRDIRFIKPTYVAVKNNIMYVTDINRIRVFDFSKKKYYVIGKGTLRNATGIAVSSDGTVYVADSGLKKVLIKKPNEPKAIIIGGDKIDGPGGMTIDESRGRFLVADAKRHVVVAFSLDGKFIRDIGQRGDAPGTFNIPYDVEVDDDGYIYVMDSGNFRVQILDPEGRYVTEFGGVGAAPGLFSRPKGIAIDSDGYIYAVDAAFGNFQIFDAEGNVYLAVGENGSAPSNFLLPFGIAIDKEEKIYVVDQMNRRVQIFERLKYEDEKDIKPVRPRDIESWK